MTMNSCEVLENPRGGRQARNFTTNVPKILDLKSSSEQIFSNNWRRVPLKKAMECCCLIWIIRTRSFMAFDLDFPTPKSFNYLWQSIFVAVSGWQERRWELVSKIGPVVSNRSHLPIYSKTNLKTGLPKSSTAASGAISWGILSLFCWDGAEKKQKSTVHHK